MKKDNTKSQSKAQQVKEGNYPAQDIDKLQRQAEKERGSKPGSQSNSSDRHNTGRGGGK
jgi:hypothetical protein